jgi:hypothetical protein
MTTRSRLVALVSVFVVVQVLGIYLFAHGFFVHRPVLSGYTSPPPPYGNKGETFDRLVFMVVDALRRSVGFFAVHETAIVYSVYVDLVATLPLESSRRCIL